jgi:hypothetical protein
VARPSTPPGSAEPHIARQARPEEAQQPSTGSAERCALAGLEHWPVQRLRGEVAVMWWQLF